MLLTKPLEYKIKHHALSDMHNEVCGLIVKKGRKKDAYRCRNIHHKKNESFVLDPQDYLNATEQFDEILAIYHSHPDTSNKFSLTDKINSFQHNKKYVLYYVPEDKFYVFDPEDPNLREQKYINRRFVWGSQDCFSLVTDFYKHELGVELVDKLTNRNDRVFQKNPNAIQKVYEDNKHLLKKVSVKSNEDLKEFDILIYKQSDQFPYHIALYLSNDLMLHQMYYHKSRIDSINSLKIQEVYRLIDKK